MMTPHALQGTRRLVASLVAGATLLLTGAAVAWAQQYTPPVLKPLDIGPVMSAYVDGVVEVRQFWTACASDPADWDKGAGILIASFKAVGLASETVRELQARLAASGADAAKYDCAGAVATARLEMPPPKAWPEYHSGVLERVGIKVVVPDAPEDPRLAKVRAVVADYIPQQKMALNCTALVQVEWFPPAYADWQDLVDKAEAAMAAAGFEAETVRSVIGPARADKLMESIAAADRQDAITGCIGDTKWMNWLATLNSYAFAGDVERALGVAK